MKRVQWEYESQLTLMLNFKYFFLQDLTWRYLQARPGSPTHFSYKGTINFFFRVADPGPDPTGKKTPGSVPDPSKTWFGSDLILTEPLFLSFLNESHNNWCIYRDWSMYVTESGSWLDLEDKTGSESASRALLWIWILAIFKPDATSNIKKPDPDPSH